MVITISINTRGCSSRAGSSAARGRSASRSPRRRAANQRQPKRERTREAAGHGPWNGTRPRRRSGVLHHGGAHGEAKLMHELGRSMMLEHLLLLRYLELLGWPWLVQSSQWNWHVGCAPADTGVRR